jgi:hypothetical protein
MADRKTTSVDALYTEGRHYPRGQNRDTGARRSIPSESPMESAAARNMAFNYHRNQDPVGSHGPGYSNDVSADDWRRGGGSGGATGKPSFDRGNAWRQPDGSIHGPPGERGQQRRPEPVTANKKQMRDGG